MIPVEGGPFTPSVFLENEEDWSEILRRLSPNLTIKGMFFQPLVTQLTEEKWESLVPELTKAPRARRYVAFSSYPQTDYHRVVLMLAEQLAGGTTLAESIRRVSREDFATFCRSVIGRVTMKLVGDARGALLKTPSVYRMVAASDHGTLEAENLDERHVRLTFDRYPHNWPYQLGQLEGIVRYFGGRPSVSIERGQGVVRYSIKYR